MDVEKEIIRDVWFFLRDHRTPPAPGLEGRLAYWDRATTDICELVSGKWQNHPLAREMGLALLAYLEAKN
ncbi:MAG: hypothetical protein IKP40_10030 [Clostridia bacterium]|nr:hypothetical protein [Clostridia bacterium]